jgi:hypothetical protein
VFVKCSEKYLLLALKQISDLMSEFTGVPVSCAIAAHQETQDIGKLPTPCKKRKGEMSVLIQYDDFVKIPVKSKVRKFSF